MVNYNNGKVYKVVPMVEDADEGDVYIGSTTEVLLSRRMDVHRGDYKCWKKGTFHFITAFKLFDKYGIENCKIVLLETVHANTRAELASREAHYILKTKCVNKQIPTNIESIDRNDYNKQYNKYNYKINRKQILDYYNEKVCCHICDCITQRGNLTRHNKSLKHKANIANYDYEYYDNDGNVCTKEEYDQCT